MSFCARFRECFTFYEADCEKLVNAFFAYTFFTKLELKRNDKQYNISQPQRLKGLFEASLNDNYGFLPE